MSARWRWIFRACAALTIAPLYVARHLPFSDLPEHLAAIATLRHYGDPAWGVARYFRVQGVLETQYLLYDVVAALLAVPLGSAERANLLLSSLVGLGFPYALAALLRATRRDERLALVACPLFWSRVLGEGLVNYVAAIPVALFALAVVARDVDEGPGASRRRTIALAALSLVLFYLHLSAFVFFALGAAVLHAAAKPRLRDLPRRLRWAAAPALAALAFAYGSSVTHPDRAAHGVWAGTIGFDTTVELARVLFAWMVDFWRSPVDDVAGVVVFGALAWLVARRAPRRAGDEPTASERAAPWLFGAALLLYFTMPSRVGFAFLLDVRMAPFVGLTAPLLVRPGAVAGLRREIALGAIALAAAVTGLHALVEMRAFERDEAAPFDKVLARMPRGKRLLALVFARQSRRVNITPFLHYGGYYMARFGGVASFSFAEVPYWPIQYRPEAAPPKKKIVFWDWNPCLYRNAVDGPYYDYVLTRGDVDPFRADPPGPRWVLIGRAHEWSLYAKDASAPPAPARPDPGPCEPGALPN